MSFFKKLKQTRKPIPRKKIKRLKAKGDGGDVLFDVGGGGPAFIFGSNLPIFGCTPN